MNDPFEDNDYIKKSRVTYTHASGWITLIAWLGCFALGALFWFGVYKLLVAIFG